MLTAWKLARTSVEYTPTSINEFTKKRKKAIKSPTAVGSTSSSLDTAVGAQFVRPPARDHLAYRGRPPGASGVPGRKRRKNLTSDVATRDPLVGSGAGVGPVLCLTSPHRMVFVEGNSKVDSGDGNVPDAGAGNLLAESKSRNYVTRPGPATRFALRGFATVDRRHTTDDDGAFAGMVPPGAWYCPSSDLVYALRDGGREIAIWTASVAPVPSGPDDTRRGGGGGINVRKRKTFHPQCADGPDSVEGASIASRCLRLPGGKAAATLTPFALPSPSSTGSKGPVLATIGAAGCCDDGSVWVAISFCWFDRGCSDFEILVVDGSSVVDEKKGNYNTSPRGLKASERRKLSAKVKDCGRSSFRALLDSHTTAATSTADNHDVDDNNSTPSVILSIQSVILLEENTGQAIALRNHQVSLTRNRAGSNDTFRLTSAHVVRYSTLEILRFEPSNSIVSVKLDANPETLLLVHRKEGAEDSNRWMFTSVDISRLDGALIDTLKSFPLPLDDVMDVSDMGTTVFSFGRVGANIVAVLMKSQSSELPECTSVLSLRIIDFPRKVELSSLSWIEGFDNTDTKNGEDRAKFFVADNRNMLNKMMHGKKCRAMITDQLDGSVALLLTSGGRERRALSLEVAFSRLETNFTMMTRTGVSPTTVRGNGASLASTLKFALSSPCSVPTTSRSGLWWPNGIARRNALGLANTIPSETECHVLRNEIDAAMEEACALLAVSAKKLIELTLSIHAEESGSVDKSKSRKVRLKVGRKVTSSIGWKKVYQQGCALILGAMGRKRAIRERKMVNGIKSDVATNLAAESTKNADVPKHFYEVAFRQTASILLLLNQGTKTLLEIEMEFRELILEVTSVLIDIVQTDLISARADYTDISLHGDNLFVSILQSCPSLSLSLSERGNGIFVGNLHVIDALLEHVQDISEGVLVSMLRFLLRNVQVEDVIAYYLNYITPDVTSKKAMRLSEQYREMADTQQGGETEGRKRVVGTWLLSEAILNFTSKIVTYSSCNHSFLTGAMRDSIRNCGEVETLLLTLARLLKSGSNRKILGEGHSIYDSSSKFNSRVNRVSLTSGTIHWISALTDAHTETILKITNEGGIAVQRIQHAVHSTLAQLELAKEVWEISDLIVSFGRSVGDQVMTISNAQCSSSRDITIAPYSIERLAF